jgi:hypothetical protein
VIEVSKKAISQHSFGWHSVTHPRGNHPRADNIVATDCYRMPFLGQYCRNHEQQCIGSNPKALQYSKTIGHHRTSERTDMTSNTLIEGRRTR